jgi:hypothetical protein
MNKTAKKPTPVVEKRDNVLRGPAPTRRNEVAREMSMRTWGDGKHKNPQDYQRGHARNPKHKGERDDRASEGMTSPTARFEEGVSADPTVNMTPQQAAEWKKQNAIHRDQFTGNEAMRRLMARFEEDVPADPTQNMTPEQAAGWERQNEVHRDEFAKTARVLSKGDSMRRLTELRKKHGGWTKEYYAVVLQEVKSGIIAPAAVVGGGYKDGRAVAIRWLTEQMQSAKTATTNLAAAWGPTLVAEGQSVPNGVPVKTATHPLDKVRGHDLWPATVARKVPTLYSQEKEEDPIAWVKLFSPYTNAVWYITEYDPSSKEAFGWADLGMGGGELGYISIRELEGLNKRGLPLVERDLYWKPMPLSRAKSSRMASAKKAAQGGHHYVAPNGDVFVDSAFLNSIRGIPGTAVESMGFGEFYADTPKGRVDFDRMRGKDFPGQVGRSHKLYGEDGADKWLLQQMIAKGQTEEAAAEGRMASGGRMAPPMQGGKTASDPLVAAWGNLMATAGGSPEADFAALDEDADPTSRDQNLAETWEKVASGSGKANAAYLAQSSLKDKILRTVAKHYGSTVREMEDELTDPDAEAVYEYIGNDAALQMQVYRDFKAKGFH